MPAHMILMSAPYMLPYLERFTPVFSHYGCELIVAEVHERLSQKEIMQYAGRFEGAICGDDRFDAEVLEKCSPNLKVISTWGTGIDSIDKIAAERLGIKVFRTPNAFTQPVADSVMGSILAFARQQPWLDKEVKLGRWEKLPGKALDECALGVIGVGDIGRAVLRRAKAFNMALYGNDIVMIPDDFVQEVGVQMVELAELLRLCDFISVNCDLNPTSRHLINRDTLKITNPDAVIINTARGSIINENDLVEALLNNHLAGAALDVFEIEPLPEDSPLKTMAHVMLAPHNSNSSPSAREHVHWNTIKNLLIGLGIPHEDFSALQEAARE